MDRKSAIVQLLLRNPVFANILMLVLLIGGGIGWFSMVRESFPDFDLDLIAVTVPYPGADPDEVEEGICQPMEEALSSVTDVKRMYTTASEGAGTAIIEVAETGDVQRVKDHVKTEIDAITTFPEDAEKPIIREISLENDVLSLVLWGDVSERELKQLANEIKDEVAAINGVSRVVVFGARNYEVSIEISEEKLRQYGLRLSDVTRAVQAASLNLPGGTLKTSTEDLKIRVLGRRYFANEFEDIVVVRRPDGTVRRLGELATIRETFDQDAKFRALYNGKPCLRIQVKKTKTEDSIRISEGVHKYLQRRRKTLPPTMKLSVFFDVSRMVEDRLILLKWNGLIGLVLVFISLWLFLDFRMSFWVTAGIPISLAGALLMMYLTGQTLNMISMFGLIMVLGIIVDDAIVVGEAIYVHRNEGQGSFEAAETGVVEVVWPVISAVLTTIVAFVPLLFIAGIMGKFVAVLPKPVIAALAISLLEALLILPVHLRHLPGTTGDRTARWPLVFRIPSIVRGWTSEFLVWFSRRIYAPILDVMLRWRYASIAFAVLLLMGTAGLIAGGLWQYRFMPDVDSDLIIAQVELRAGTPVEETRRVAQHLLEAWEMTEADFAHELKPYSPRPMTRLRNWLFSARNLFDGNQLRLSAGVFSLVGGSQGAHRTMVGDNQTSMWIELMPSEMRNVHYKRILNCWRKHAYPIPGAVKATFQGMAGGPPGDDIQIDLRAHDLDHLILAQDKFMTHLKTFNGVQEVTSTHVPGKRELRVELKDEAQNLGLTLRDVALQLRRGFYGDEAMRIQRNGDETKIMVRYPEDERKTMTQLQQIRIRTPGGQEVPFDLVARVDRRPGPAQIRREGGMRSITVKADVDDAIGTGDIMKSLQEEFLPELSRETGVMYRLGFDAADRERSNKSMMVGGAFAVLMIFLVMATVFKSYLQPLIILLTIPFGLMGAVAGHLLYQTISGRPMPLTFMGALGMVALTGIVVNDSIVLIVAVNERVRAGRTFAEALRDAGQRRFRAIILTSLTTFIGLFPLIMEKSFQAQILIPMAISVAFGVVFGTLSTLILIPCMLGVLNDFRRIWQLMWRGRWPTSEEVEPVEESME